MFKLSPIKTPLADINLFRDNDGDLWVQQNNLTVALGYNKFLSRSKMRGSGIGKFFHGEGVIKKFANLNLINLRKLVDVILPQFIADFFRNVNHGNSSTRQFFLTPPEKIFHNTEHVLKLFKEVLYSMSSDCYDPNSNEAKIGKIAEFIVCRRYSRNPNRKITLHPDSYSNGAHPVDLLVQQGNIQNLVEVKSLGKKPFGKNSIPCLFFPTAESPLKGFALNCSYAKEKGIPLVIQWVSQSDKCIYSALAANLEQRVELDGETFPNHATVAEKDFIVFHTKQFEKSPLTNEELGLFAEYNRSGKMPPPLEVLLSETRNKKFSSDEYRRQKTERRQNAIDRLPKGILTRHSILTLAGEKIKTAYFNAELYLFISNVQLALGMDGSISWGASDGWGFFLKLGKIILDANANKCKGYISAASLRDVVLPQFLDSLNDGTVASKKCKDNAIRLLNALKELAVPAERSPLDDLFDNAETIQSKSNTATKSSVANSPTYDEAAEAFKRAMIQRIKDRQQAEIDALKAKHEQELQQHIRKLADFEQAFALA